MAINFTMPGSANEWSGLRTMTAALSAMPNLIGAWSTSGLPSGALWSWPSVTGEQALTQTTNGRAPTAANGVVSFNDMHSLFIADVLTSGQTLTLGMRFRTTNPANDVQNIFGRGNTTVGVYRTGPQRVVVGTQEFSIDATAWQTVILTRSPTQDVAELNGTTRVVSRTGGWDTAHFRVGHYQAAPASQGLIGDISRIIAVAASPSATDMVLIRRFLNG